MIALSLFTGIGGLDLAFEVAGGRVVAMCERDEFCKKVLRKHWSRVPIFDDVRELRGDDIGAVDIIFGGFPCQPFSVAGNRKGQSDERYLWGEFSRLVAEIKPLWVVAENVPGILSLAADEVCADLERLDYSVGIWNYEAAALGAPHRRARVFFVAHAASERRNQWRAQCERFERGITSISASSAIPNSEMLLGATLGWNESQRVLSDVPNTDSKDVHGTIEHQNAARFIGFANICNISDADRKRQPQPQGREREFGGWACDGSGWELKSCVGRSSNGFPYWLDGNWERGIPRVASGVKNRVSRLRALGNAVVPAQAYPIFKAIVEIEKYEEEKMNKYYPINETQAKQARAMWSFRDYVANSTTEKYQKQVDECYALAECVKQKVEGKDEQIDLLCDRYAKKLAEYYNRDIRIQLMCPSVMISGASNFPSRKKEQQNQAERRNIQFWDIVQQIPGKIHSLQFPDVIIKNGDKEAIARLKQKIVDLEVEREEMKTRNHSTLQLSNIGARIRATRDRLTRIEYLKANKHNLKSEYFRIEENQELMRLQLFFDGKPNDKIRNILKSCGYKWSPKNGAWQRQLTPNALRSVEDINKNIREMNKAEE